MYDKKEDENSSKFIMIKMMGGIGLIGIYILLFIFIVAVLSSNWYNSQQEICFSFQSQKKEIIFGGEYKPTRRKEKSNYKNCGFYYLDYKEPKILFLFGILLLVYIQYPLLYVYTHTH